MNASLQTELWTSWASVLRAYAAMHGLNSRHHAVVEVSADAIILRVHTRWLRFTHTEQQTSAGTSSPFALHEDGTVLVDGRQGQMDMAAEELTRGLLLG